MLSATSASYFKEYSDAEQCLTFPEKLVEAVGILLGTPQHSALYLAQQT
jgi:hypothetical protein